MKATLSNKKFIIIFAVAATILIGITATFLLKRNARIVLNEGQNIAVIVIADSFEELYGYQFKLNYQKDQLEYQGTLTSKISDIQTIFSKSMDGYELVGATMIGENDGVSGKNKAVCEMVFTAKKEIDLKNLDISISEVNIVQSDMDYLEDIQGWKLKTAAGS